MAYELLQEEGRAGVSNGDAEEATEVKWRIDYARIQSDMVACGKATKSCLVISAVPVAAFVISAFVFVPLCLFLAGIVIVTDNGWTPLAIFFLCLLPSILVIICICSICCYAVHNWVVCEANPPQPD